MRDDARLPDVPEGASRSTGPPKPASERMVFDFETNAWILPDAFNVRAQGREIILPKPDTEPAPGRWTAPVRKPKTSPLTIAVVWLVVALVVAAIVARSLLPTIPVILIGLVADVIHSFEKTGEGRARPEDLRLLEDPNDPDICLVALTVYRDGQNVGRDRGVAWFEDGRLLYSGHRTSFAIGGEDVLPQREHGSRNVPLRVPRGTATVVLAPLSLNTPMGGKQEMRFLKALHAFRRRPSPSRGPRQWPPLEPWSEDRDGGIADARRT